MHKARIFISYSHRGNGPEWKAALLRALHVFEQHHLLDVWQDGKIRVSSFWDDDIRQAMTDARLAVVLLTKEALESEFILKTEFPTLRERQHRGELLVFPVICEDCDWRAHDWLRATQAPNESRPLSQLSRPAQDHVFRKLATDIAVQLSRIALAELATSAEPPGADRVYLDKFPLARDAGLREEKLIGREQELALLDLAFAQPHTAIVSLVAWGGVGKTMLVQHWLLRLERERWCGARRVYAWSFYSQGTKEDRQASEDSFLAHALEWFGVQCEPTLSPWDKGRLLADAVTCEGILLVLDGIEPLQYPPGPMGGQLRAPGVQSLLKQLARKATDAEHHGLCLVTTREPLTDLIKFERRPDATWGSMLRVDLGNLTEEAGAAVLHHTGANRAGAAAIKADDVELIAAGREVDGHPLTLTLLGRFLARAHGGDIRRRDLVKFEEADRNEQGGTTFKMLTAFENWFARSGEFGARQLAVLRMLGLFDRPADAGCIGALRNPPAIVGLTDALFTVRPDASTYQPTVQPILEEDWNTATAFLADFGLVVIQTEANDSEQLLDCHPLIREHFARKLLSQPHDGWRFAHGRLYEHLISQAEFRPATAEGMEPLFHSLFHGCSADLHQHACERIYWSRILRGHYFFSTKKLGLLTSDLAAIGPFFTRPWNQPAMSLTDVWQAWLLARAGYRLGTLGRVNEAMAPLKEGLLRSINAGDWEEAASVAGNFVEMEIVLGSLEDSVTDGARASLYAKNDENILSQAMNIAVFSDALHQNGQIDQARKFFEAAEELQREGRKDWPLLNGLWGFFYDDLLLNPSERSAWRVFLEAKYEGANEDDPKLIHQCRQVEERTQTTLRWIEDLPENYGLHEVALDNLTLGRAALYRTLFTKESVCDSIRSYLDSADTKMRMAGTVHYVPRVLLTRAWLRSLDGDAAGAWADLDEAWDIAERGPMRLHLADIHLHRARLFFREGTYPWNSPLTDLAAAEKLINDCGYHRRDGELADARKAMLGQ